MPARVVVVGLDACEATLLDRWANEGELPTIGLLMAEAASARLGNPLDTLPGAIWPEIVTGRSGARDGIFFHPMQVHTGECVLRPVGEEEQDSEAYYWTIASRHGCRVAVIDQPQVAVASHINGLQICEWGCHDRTYSVATSPSELLNDVRRMVGDHPVHDCDPYALEIGGFERLLDDLLVGIERKSALLLDLLDREDWDLFTCTIAETHCAGHHFWRYLDAASPVYDANAPERLQNAIKEVYRRADGLVGKIIESAGPKARAIVFTSHGMGPYIGGSQLLPEFLTRLGMSSDRGRGRHSSVRALQYLLRNRTPLALRPWVKSAQRFGLVRWLQSRAGSLLEPLTDPRTRAAAVPNNRVGGIRLNLAGREPFGSLRPGPEADAVIEEIREELLALERPETGQKIVVGVQTAEDAFGADHHSDVPDLMVNFNRNIGLIESCQSDRVGTIHVPAITPAVFRSGDHTDESRLWMLGPETPRRTEIHGGRVIDIAPTVLDLLGVPVPATIEGRPLSWH